MVISMSPGNTGPLKQKKPSKIRNLERLHPVYLGLYKPLPIPRLKRRRLSDWIKGRSSGYLPCFRGLPDLNSSRQWPLVRAGSSMVTIKERLQRRDRSRFERDSLLSVGTFVEFTYKVPYPLSRHLLISRHQWMVCGKRCCKSIASVLYSLLYSLDVVT